MKMWSINTVIIFLCSKNVFASEKEYCLHTDDDCLTKSIKDRIYQKFVRGLDGVESSDPLQVDKIEVDLQNLKYVLSKATLTGLGNCDFLRLKLTREGESLVTYELLCPNLVIKSDYELKGAVDEVTAEGKDTCEITYYNYRINVTGKYEKTVDDDGKHHFHIKEFWLDLDSAAEATSEYKNLSVNNEKEVAGFSRKLELKTRDIVMKTFLTKYIGNLKEFNELFRLKNYITDMFSFIHIF